jgi:hypothetical protein
MLSAVGQLCFSVNKIKHEMYLQFLIYPIALDMKIIKMNWSKELWFALLFHFRWLYCLAFDGVLLRTCSWNKFF